jgi:hypothetical protein
MHGGTVANRKVTFVRTAGVGVKVWNVLKLFRTGSNCGTPGNKLMG